MTHHLAWLRAALVAICFAVFANGTVLAQQSPLKDMPTSDGGDEETYSRDSPRASMVHFIELTRSGDYDGAADYLELAPDDKDLGPELARKLRAVLDRKVWIEEDALSPLATGNTDDGLPGLTDEVGHIETKGVTEPVRIVRRRREAGLVWIFSHATVGRVDGWYESLDDRWLLEHMPPRLLRTGPRDLMWWQWLALPLLVAVSWLLGILFSAISAKLMGAVAARSKYQWDDLIVARLRRPVTLWWALGVAYFALPFLALYAPAEKFVEAMMRTLFLVGFFFALSGVIDVSAETILRSQWSAHRQTSASLISLGARSSKVLVFAIAIVALLSQLGYPVASILAGLGVGGLAVALAAQKTVENLFGAFSIGADQPFAEGDLVRFDGITGTCERIGLRSTRFRTAERTVVSIPNGKLADMRLETFARRDRLRFGMTLGLVRTTTTTQVKQILDEVSKLLSEHPKLFPNSANVRFDAYGPSSLDITLEAYFDTRNWGEFTLIKQDLLLRIMEIVENAGSALALNAAHVQLVQPSPGLEMVAAAATVERAVKPESKN